MAKIQLRHPLLIMLYGFPGSGKTLFARNMCNTLHATYIGGDRIRSELFEKPRYDKAEDSVVNHIIEYMAEEFLNAGVSVVLDVNAHKAGHRRHLRDLAKIHKAHTLLVWFQVDADTAFSRLASRDRRHLDDKYSRQYDRTQFDSYVATMQHPGNEDDGVVLSGKHSFLMQRSSVLRKLFDMNLVSADDISSNVVKPGMVNLVPANRDKRNIHIR